MVDVDDFRGLKKLELPLLTPLSGSTVIFSPGSYTTLTNHVGGRGISGSALTLSTALPEAASYGVRPRFEGNFAFVLKYARCSKTVRNATIISIYCNWRFDLTFSLGNHLLHQHRRPQTQDHFLPAIHTQP